MRDRDRRKKDWRNFLNGRSGNEANYPLEVDADFSNSFVTLNHCLPRPRLNNSRTVLVKGKEALLIE